MATIQERNGSFRVLFCYRGKRHTVNLGRVSKPEAEAFVGSADLTLLRLKQKLLTIPPGTAISEFLLHGVRRRRPPPSRLVSRLLFPIFVSATSKRIEMGQWNATVS
jgi:hypothetical protein